MKNTWITLALAGASLAVQAQTLSGQALSPLQELADRVSLHAQSTWVWQAKPAFNAAYSGANSLRPQRERSYSFTATGDLGLRLWDGAQLHFNPEAAQGLPLSNLLGSGGLSNGELARTSGPNLIAYKARLFFQQRWNAGGASEAIDADFNEIGGQATARRWTFTAGTFSLLDYFDNSPYAKDPREQFLNWSFLTHGAWDYAADARGYTSGALLEYRGEGWSVRGGRVAQPRESNGLALDNRIGVHYGDQVELDADLPVSLPAGPLHGRLLAFRNRMNAGNFNDALALGGVPSLALVRRDQTKTGWGLTLEAPTGENSGVFVRASRNSGQLETYAFTEIDQQLSLGGQFSGAAWGRRADTVGVAVALNGLSAPHRNYLAAGGLGFFLGDGALNYGRERVFETYYRYALPEFTSRIGKLASAASVGFQQIANPGYNRDRGPVRVLSVRLHTEF